MPHVAHLTSVHRPFDHRIFFKECRSLVQAGYEVTLMAPAAPVDWSSAQDWTSRSGFSEEVRDGVRIVGLPPLRSRWDRPATWWRLLRRVMRLKPDLVHFHDPELLLIVPLLRLTLGRQAPLVYDVHEYLLDSIAHKEWVPAFLRQPAAWLVRQAERALGTASALGWGVDGLVFVVEGQAPMYAGWRARSVIVHNYPDPSAFSDTGSAADGQQREGVALPAPTSYPGRFRLVYIGSLFARRGIMQMLEALRLVVPQAPETLLLLGGAFESDAFRMQVQGFIQQHDLGGHVVLLGWVDHTKVRDYLASADVAWLPELPVRQYQRPALSTKLLESMLMGLPVVSSDFPDRRPFIEESKCGFLVDAEDPTAHAQAILWLYAHPEERSAMGARGQKLILERYTWQAEASKLCAMYDHLLV